MSPTEEEYDIAYKSYCENGRCKKILFFFNDKPIQPHDIDVEQIALIRKFQERLSRDGVFYKMYSSVEDFKSILHVALYKTFVSILSNEGPNNIVTGGLRGKKTLDFDDNTKLFYDSLLTSPRVGKIKTAFIESYVLLFLYHNPNSSLASLCEYLVRTLEYDNKKLYENVISKMKQSGYIEGVKSYFLSSQKHDAIESIVEQSERSEKSLLEECNKVCNKYNISLDSTALYNNITRLFDECYNVNDLGERVEIANKQQVQGRVTDQLVSYIATATGLPVTLSTNIATEFVKVCCNNSLFDKCSTSKMFLNLFKQDKLEQYMSQTKRFLFLDTQVLMQIVCTLSNNEVADADYFYSDGRLFWNGVKGNSSIKLLTTNCYIDELIGNMEEALRVAVFLKFNLQDLFGRSKNVFLRDFLRLKKSCVYETIEEYFANMLGVEESDIDSLSFRTIAYDALYDLFETIGFEIVDIPYFERFEEYKTEYQKLLCLYDYAKSDYALSNDLKMILYFSDFVYNKNQVPYLVTRDSSFARIRTKLLERFKNLQFWHIYSPLGIANMISVMTLKLNPSVINRNIVSIVERSYDSYNSSDTFLDVIANYVDSKKLSDWEFAKKMKALKKSLEDRGEDEQTASSSGLPPVEVYFNYLLKHYSKNSDSLNTLISLFTDNDYADRVFDVVKVTIGEFKVQKVDQPTVSKQFDKLIKSYQYSHSNLEA